MNEDLVVHEEENKKRKNLKKYHPYSQLDLESIHCSGCRKAIENEIKQHIAVQKGLIEVKRRARSHQRK